MYARQFVTLFGKRRLTAAELAAAVAALFAGGEQGVWYDPSDFTTLFQDSAGTTPVTAVGQPVGKILDKSGRGNHATQATGASQPLLQQDASGRYYLDHSNHSLATAAIDFTGTNKLTLFAGVRKLSESPAGIVCEFGTNVATNNGSFFVAVPNGAGVVSFASKGTTLVQNNLPAAAPITAVMACSGDISAPSAVLRVNTVSQTVATTQGTGNYGNLVLYIGRRGGATLPFIGRLYSLIIRGAASSTGQFLSGEAYVNNKTGAY